MFSFFLFSFWTKSDTSFLVPTYQEFNNNFDNFWLEMRKVYTCVDIQENNLVMEPYQTHVKTEQL